MRFFDSKEVRTTVLFTTECRINYIGTKPGGVKEPTLSHRTYFTTKLIPTLDKLIDNQNMGKMRSMVQDLAETVFSDGWTVVDHHPIVNVIMVSLLYTLFVLPLTLWDRRKRLNSSLTTSCNTSRRSVRGGSSCV